MKQKTLAVRLFTCVLFAALSAQAAAGNPFLGSSSAPSLEAHSSDMSDVKRQVRALKETVFVLRKKLEQAPSNSPTTKKMAQDDSIDVGDFGDLDHFVINGKHVVRGRGSRSQYGYIVDPEGRVNDLPMRLQEKIKMRKHGE